MSDIELLRKFVKKSLCKNKYIPLNGPELNRENSTEKTLDLSREGEMVLWDRSARESLNHER